MNDRHRRAKASLPSREQAQAELAKMHAVQGKTRLAAQKALPANAACVHLPDRTADPAIAHASGHGQAKPAGCVAALAAKKFRRARFSALLRIASALDRPWRVVQAAPRRASRLPALEARWHGWKQPAAGSCVDGGQIYFAVTASKVRSGG